ncbi:Gfo/Idh/MocA family protein [Thermodesulfobacteriota bacterium]
MNCLVIGYGSIGERHSTLLASMGHSVFVVSHRDIRDYPRFDDIGSAFLNQKFHYVIVSNKTYEHYNSLLELINQRYKGLLLIEKPVFEKIREVKKYDYRNTYIGYNLRWHPIVREIINLTSKRKIYSMQAYVGQYLPEWRPNTNFKNCYSASSLEGGGVLRDLSHELDYMRCIAGSWKRIASIGGTYSELGIESDDIYSLLMEMERCPIASLQMNYLDRRSRREIIINLQGMTIKADLIGNMLEVNRECKRYAVDRNQMYLDQHKAIIDSRSDKLCTFREGLEIVHLIEKAENASREKVWKWV